MAPMMSVSRARELLMISMRWSVDLFHFSFKEARRLGMRRATASSMSSSVTSRMKDMMDPMSSAMASMVRGESLE